MTDYPINISFRNMDSSDSVEANIRQRIAGFDTFFDRIVYCDVVVEAPHRRGHKGKTYEVRIVIGVPGKDVVVSRSEPLDHAHEDVYVTVRDAFDAAVRQLEDLARKYRGDVKHHEVPLHGVVLRRFTRDGYGFIKTSDDQEIYFHRNSVVDGDFDDLNDGDEVRLAVAYRESAEGPQATTVKKIGKHHLVG